MNTPQEHPIERQILVNLLHFFSLGANDQQFQLACYARFVVERKKQAHVDDPLIELATDLEVWADRHCNLNADSLACPILVDLSELLELILRKDQHEMVSIESLSNRHYWNIVRRFCKEALREMKDPQPGQNNSIWDMLAVSGGG